MMLKRNDKIKVAALNIFLFAALFGLVSFNKEVLRPAITDPGLLKTLTGCFPNFIAAYLISLAPVVAVLIRKPKQGRIMVYAASIVVSVVLIVEEIKPMWGANEYFDVYDIVASILGSLIAILTFEIIYRIGKRRSN